MNEDEALAKIEEMMKQLDKMHENSRQLLLKQYFWLGITVGGGLMLLVTQLINLVCQILRS